MDAIPNLLMTDFAVYKCWRRVIEEIFVLYEPAYDSLQEIA